MANLFRRFPSDDLEFDLSVADGTELFYQERQGQYGQDFENKFWEAPQVGVVGQNAETDTAQALTRVKQKAVGQNAETDAALALVRVKQKAVGLNAEVDSALALTRVKRILIGQAVETNSAGVLTALVVKMFVIGQVVEEGTALGMLAVRVASTRMVLERDLSLVVKPRETAFDVPRRDISFDVR